MTDAQIIAKADELLHQVRVFGRAIGDAAVRLGIIKAGTTLTGPQALLLLEDITRLAEIALNKETEDFLAREKY